MKVQLSLPRSSSGGRLGLLRLLLGSLLRQHSPLHRREHIRNALLADLKDSVNVVVVIVVVTTILVIRMNIIITTSIIVLMKTAIAIMMIIGILIIISGC